MAPGHANKRSPLRYQSWLAVADSSAPSNPDNQLYNMFLDSKLVQQECTSEPVPWIPESAYKVPVGSRDGVPLSGEGPRSYSEAQESAQLLGGAGLPTQILRDLIKGANLDAQQVLSIINLTPWDGTLDLAAAQLQKNLANSPKMRVLSISPDNTIMTFSQNCIAETLMQDPLPLWCLSIPHPCMHNHTSCTLSCQDWKAGNHCMGKVPKYQPEPPAETAEEAVALPKLLITQLEQQDGTTRCLLPLSIRKKWLEHPVHGPEWRDLLLKFDRMMGTTDVTTAVMQQEPEALARPIPIGDASTWSGEPVTLANLKATYTIKSTFPGRNPSINYIVVPSNPLEGKQQEHMETTQDQELKLFIAAPDCDVELTTEQYMLAHGQANFLKAKRAEELREKGTDPPLHPILYVTIAACT